MPFSVRTTDVEFEVAFAILQFCIRAFRTFMIVEADCRHKIEAVFSVQMRIKIA